LTRRGSVAPGGERPLAVINRQIRHLTRLVDDLLDVARVTSGKIALQRVAIDLVPLVQAATEEVTATQPSAELVLDLPAQEVPVAVDAVRIHQVLNNLLTNAFKYTPPGGRVKVALLQEPDWLVIQVADTGVGISQDVLPTIFDPFAQADRTLDRAQGGMGLGLTVVRALVELHGGRVEVSSAGPGQGSTFSVRLPRDRELQLSEPVAPVPTELAPHRSRRLLLVEDAEDIRESLHELLLDMGHRVEVAADGEQGVARALDWRPEVALVDIGLPRIDGYEVARRIRAALGRDILLVALTGYGQPEDAMRARAAGFDVHLRKPMSIDDLDRLLGAALGSGAGDQAGQDQCVQRHDQRNKTREHDAVFEDRPKDGGLVADLARGRR
jgi:CheY-like chemotaxis protein/anti-sigma regulatory factor (Ser/Thr protein kinase)